MSFTRRQGLLATVALAVTGPHWPSPSRPARQPAQPLDRPAEKACAGAARRPASQLRYAGMAADRAALKAYLDSLSAVPAASFQAGSPAQQMAFLINAYNAFTVELILTRYPDLTSIKELGSLLQSPWKPKWIPLLGGKVSLDEIEHEMLRAKGRYKDPRVHFAVNCASIGCPALREEAFVPSAWTPSWTNKRCAS